MRLTRGNLVESREHLSCAFRECLVATRGIVWRLVPIKPVDAPDGKVRKNTLLYFLNSKIQNRKFAHALGGHWKYRGSLVA